MQIMKYSFIFILTKNATPVLTVIVVGSFA